MRQGVAHRAGGIGRQGHGDGSVGDEVLGPCRSRVAGVHAMALGGARVPPEELLVAVGSPLEIDIEDLQWASSLRYERRWYGRAGEM